MNEDRLEPLWNWGFPVETRLLRHGVEIVSRVYPEQAARVALARQDGGEIRGNLLVDLMDRTARRGRMRRLA